MYSTLAYLYYRSDKCLWETRGIKQALKYAVCYMGVTHYTLIKDSNSEFVHCGSTRIFVNEVVMAFLMCSLERIVSNNFAS